MRVFFCDEQGITSIEYGLIALALAVFVVSILYGDNSFIQALEVKFNLLSNTVTEAVVSKN
ncbi:TPA: Flp family type IVb pilin [Pasteurella multocida]|nr:Flp family type IVb pilin [Pasteurella multocida]